MFEKKTVYIQQEGQENKAILEFSEIRSEILFRAFTLSFREDGRV